jgi:hypothetical protein
VTYMTSSFGPPNITLLRLRTGNGTTRSSVPPGAKRYMHPPRTSADQT